MVWQFDLNIKDIIKDYINHLNLKLMNEQRLYHIIKIDTTSVKRDLLLNFGYLNKLFNCSLGYDGKIDAVFEVLSNSDHFI